MRSSICSAQRATRQKPFFRSGIAHGYCARGSFYHLISQRVDFIRHNKAEGLRSLEIDDQLELRRQLNWKFIRLLAPQNEVDVRGRTPKQIGQIDAIVLVSAP
jgi:hypothetical protein